MKRIAILQSNYIPWKGYFDIIASVDEFIIYDEVQYTKNDWRNRNIIKTPAGPQWLTIPVLHTGRFGQLISATQVSDHTWSRKHWQSLVTYYSKAPHFNSVGKQLRDTFAACKDDPFLSTINLRFIRFICELLGIRTPIVSSLDYPGSGDRNERLLNLCMRSGATQYLSGPAAHNYIDKETFDNAGINICWMDYSRYPEYPQLHTHPFLHQVSALDLLLCVGPEDAQDYMRPLLR